MTYYITYDYMGGLGNQLFGIYTAISFGLMYNKKFIFEYKDISPSITHRLTYWDSILKNLNTLKSFEFNKIEWSQIYENNDGTYSLPNNLECNIKLNGYFQNLNNFNYNLETINNILNIKLQKEEIKNKNKELFEKQTIGIHFRLGDYKYLQHCHPLIPDEYYINCLKDINDIENKDILIFCEKEDYNLVENRMTNILNCLGLKMNFQIIKNRNDLEELFLLSCCNGIIIANSTFSWWAGVYSNHSNVYIPYKWFHTETYKSLIFKDWNIVKF